MTFSARELPKRRRESRTSALYVLIAGSGRCSSSVPLRNGNLPGMSFRTWCLWHKKLVILLDGAPVNTYENQQTLSQVLSLAIENREDSSKTESDATILLTRSKLSSGENSSPFFFLEKNEPFRDTLLLKKAMEYYPLYMPIPLDFS